MKTRSLALAVSALAAVALYRSLFSPSAPPPPDSEAGATRAAQAPVDDDLPLPAAAIGREMAGRLAANETVAAAMARCGLSAAQVTEATGALESVIDFRRARPGALLVIELTADDARIEYVRFENALLEVVEATRDTDEAELVGRRVALPLATRVEPVGVEIRDSLYRALDDAGEGPELATLLADVFAWDIDFYRDQHPGDRFRVIVEKVYQDETFIRYGRVLAAEYSGRIGTLRTFWYEPSGDPGRADYYLEDGRSARKLFLATPLEYTRVSSRFSHNRRHPILGYRRAHLGVDYAAPRGTPVRAMAGGTVIFAGRHQGSGNLVKIRHRNGLVSSYAHLNRIAGGIRRGSRVEQKQRIGTVGSTGLATGPHLHFAVERQGKYLNPQDLKLSRLDPIAPGHRAPFARLVAERVDALAAIELGEDGAEPRVATLVEAPPQAVEPGRRRK